MPKKDIKVPNIGEFKDVEVIEIIVKKGQEIKKNDPLITIESDKSSVEIPSLHNGIVTELNLNVGDKVSEGDKILEIELKDNQVETQLKTEEIKTIKKENTKEKKIEIRREVGSKNVKLAFKARDEIKIDRKEDNEHVISLTVIYRNQLDRSRDIIQLNFS